MMDDEKRGRKAVRDALERATGEREPEIGPLLDRVPSMMRQAQSKRQARRPATLGASVYEARWAVPRLAAATAVLALIGAVLLFTGGGTSTTGASGGIDELIASGNGITDQLIVESILRPEEER